MCRSRAARNSDANASVMVQHWCMLCEDLGRGLRHLPVHVDSVEWRFRRYATREHPAGEYRNYWLAVTLRCPDAPVMAIRVQRSRRGLDFQRLTRRRTAEAVFTFVDHPFEVVPTVSESDRDARLGFDTSSFGVAHVRVGDVLQTGCLWPVVGNDDGSMTNLELLAVSDTKTIRGRWRLRPGQALGLPPEFSFLGAGHWSGSQPETHPLESREST